MSIAKFRNDMATPINKVAFGGERLILTRPREGAVALVSVEDLALLEALEDEADLKAALKARKEKGGVPWEKTKAQLAADGGKSLRGKSWHTVLSSNRLPTAN